MSKEHIRAAVSRETFERLEVYAGLLEKWNPRINLVSKSTIPQLWDRHIADSLQVFDLAEKFAKWVDIGSGGGFPGLVCAICAVETSPKSEFVLVESDQRKCAFLRNVIRETGVNAVVKDERIERTEPQNADILSARALAALSDLMEFADRHLLADGTALFPKGMRWKDEVLAAQVHWRFVCDAVPSKTDSEAVILKIGGFHRAELA